MNNLDFKKKIIELDDSFTKFVISELINEPYVYFIPTNKLEEETKFFNALVQGLKYEPKFKYDKKLVSHILKKLKEYRLQFNQLNYPEDLDHLKMLYIKKIDELIIFTKMIGAINQKKFTQLSYQAYGVPSSFLYYLATGVVFMTRTFESFQLFKKKTYLTNAEILKSFNSFCIKYGFDDWTLEFSSEILSTAFILPSNKKVILRDSLKYDASDILMLFKHELGVHGKRHVNGKKILGLFSFGLAKYDEQEEGLATFQELGFYNPLKVIFMPALKVIAVRTALNKNFYETFKKIYNLTGDVDNSFSLAMRTKRGVFNNQGAYTKDCLYFSGFLKMLKYYFKSGCRSSKIDDLFIGKISFDELNKLDELKNMKNFFQIREI